MNGWVTNLSARLGDYASVGQIRVSLVDGDSFWVDGYFQETSLSAIRVGDPAVIRLMGHDQLLHGHVDSIARGIDPLLENFVEIRRRSCDLKRDGEDRSEEGGVISPHVLQGEHGVERPIQTGYSRFGGRSEQRLLDTAFEQCSEKTFFGSESMVDHLPVETCMGRDQRRTGPGIPPLGHNFDGGIE